jgi:uncharacterized protein (DUF58 family)
MLAALRQFVRKKTNTWLFQLRDVEPGEVFLGRRRVFIVPTGAGLGFAALLVVLLVGSTNYTLGLGFALTFVLAMCGMVDMLYTFRNMAYLHLVPGACGPVFAGEEARFELRMINRSKLDRYALWIDFLQAGEPRHPLDVLAGDSTAVTLSCPTEERGYLAAPRVRLLTRFPLGLFRAWSYWQPDSRVLVYPFPEPGAPPLPIAGEASMDGVGRAGNDDFAGVRNYVPGDSVRHLAWRQMARLDPSLGGQLLAKHFEGGARAELVLDFGALPASMPVELKLSRMTSWVLDAEQRAVPYAMCIGAVSIAPSVGAAHSTACLRALALYGMAGESAA